jgi:transposase
MQPHLPAPEDSVRPKTQDIREILNAMYCFLKSGCGWRLLPHGLLTGPR